MLPEAVLGCRSKERVESGESSAVSKAPSEEEKPEEDLPPYRMLRLGEMLAYEYPALSPPWFSLACNALGDEGDEGAALNGLEGAVAPRYESRLRPIEGSLVGEGMDPVFAPAITSCSFSVP